MVDGKDKGNDYELKVYRFFRDLGIPAVCVRGSGSLKDESSDILLNRKYLMECKHYNPKNMRPALIKRWWAKICREAREMKYRPVLNVKLNHRTPTYRLLLPHETDPDLWVEVSESVFLKILRGTLTW